MNGRYVLIGQTAVPCDDLLEWASAFELSDRRVLLTHLPWCTVSTVFLGLDHSFGFGPPLLFESMAFPHDASALGLECDCRRCPTWLEAEAMHKAMVARLGKLRPLAGWLFEELLRNLRAAAVEFVSVWRESQPDGGRMRRRAERAL